MTGGLVGIALVSLGMVLTPGPNMIYLVHILLQSLALGSVQIAVGTLVIGLIVLTAGGLAAFLAARPLWVPVQRYATGTVLGGFAITMATDRSKALVSA